MKHSVSEIWHEAESLINTPGQFHSSEECADVAFNYAAGTFRDGTTLLMGIALLLYKLNRAEHELELACYR